MKKEDVFSSEILLDQRSYEELIIFSWISADPNTRLDDLKYIVKDIDRVTTCSVKKLDNTRCFSKEHAGLLENQLINLPRYANIPISSEGVERILNIDETQVEAILRHYEIDNLSIRLTLQRIQVLKRVMAYILELEEIPSISQVNSLFIRELYAVVTSR